MDGGDFRTPNDSERISIIGKTGSGKTQAGAWHLSLRDFEARPWVVYDFKGDPIIGQLPHTKPLDLARVPDELGVYIVRPLPSELEAVEAQLWKLHARGDVGLWVDEGYMIPDIGAFQAILTQGRTRNMPVITLSQRPVWLSRFVFSESDYFQIFHLNDKRDRQTIQSFIPDDVADVDQRLPRFHSYYYDVAEDDVVIMRPVPELPDILASLDDKLRPEEQQTVSPIRRRIFI